MMASTKLYPELTAATEFAKQATHDLKAVEKQLQQIPLTPDGKIIMHTVLITNNDKLTQLSTQAEQHQQQIQQQVNVFKRNSQNLHHQLEQMTDAKSLLADKVKQAKQQLSDHEKTLKSEKTTLKKKENTKDSFKSELKDTLAKLKQSTALHNELQRLLQQHDHYAAIATEENKKQRHAAKVANVTLEKRDEAKQRAHNHHLMKDHDMIRTPEQLAHVNNVIKQETKKTNQLDSLFQQQKMSADNHSHNTKIAKEKALAMDNEITTFMRKHHLGQNPQAAYQALTQQMQQLQKKSDKLGDNIVNCDKQIKKQNSVVKQQEHDVKSARQQLQSCQKNYKTITDKVEQTKKQEKTLHQQIDEASHLHKVLALIDKKIESIKDKISDKITHLVHHVKQALNHHSPMLKVASPSSLATNHADQNTETNVIKPKR